MSGLLQDEAEGYECQRLSRWFASRIDARETVRRFHMKSYKPHCRNCDEEYATERWKLGYKVCMPCGEKLSHDAVRTVVPMHKSNYMMITDMADLKGINNKGGFHNGL